jgi:hypothetical protein
MGDDFDGLVVTGRTRSWLILLAWTAAGQVMTARVASRRR